MKESSVSTAIRRLPIVNIEVNPSVGLTRQQIELMREKYGRNVLSPPVRDPWWKQFLQKFDDPTIKILLGAALISLIITAVSIYVLNDHESSFIDSIGIFIAVALATVVGFLSERKSAKEFDLLNDVKEAIDVKVIRDGDMHTIPISDVVVGDIVRLDMGDKVPADGVIVGSLHLAVDESLLTGESMPAEKASLDKSVAIEKAGDEFRVSRGTMVVDGHGVYIVTAVGDATKMGEIAQLLAEKQDESPDDETPLKQKLSVLAKQISVTGVSAATLIFTIMAINSCLKSQLMTELWQQRTVFIIVTILSMILGILLMKKVIRPFFASMDMEINSPKLQALMVIPMAVASFVLVSGIWGMVTDPALAIGLLNSLLIAFVIAVTIIVVAVPEGLPMMVTVSLALNMMKMAKENCLVRKLIASETIGSATVICTDKTGTLTQNKMRPVWFYLGMKAFQAKDVKSTFNTPEWTRIIRNIAINSEAQLEKKEEQILGVGNPTECALLMLLHEYGVNYLDLRNLHPKTWQVDYNSERKMSVAVVEEHEKVSCYIKGAPERILESCTHASINGELAPIEKHRDAILAAIQSASDQSLRVIAFGERIPDGGTCHNGDVQNCISCGMRVFIGMVGIADPLREEVPGAVDTCRQAGIAVKMITGDAMSTAKVIALQAGILKPGELVMTSEQFQKLSDKELHEVVNNLKVLARSTPMDKLRLVQALHRRGEVVAMTGDGTNDAPALKAADVGLSMGKSGTEVAKEASDIVLVDDNFKSIVTGVWWGRTLYQNIQRFLQFQLSVNVVALLSAMIGPLLGVPLPLTVTQLLWVNIIMDTFAALALSTDPPRPNTMVQTPISRDTHIITPAMIVTILISSLYQVVILYTVLFMGWFRQDKGLNSIESLTVFFTVFVMFQFWHKFNCRSLRHDDSPFALLHKNKMFLIIVATITIVQIIIVQVGGPIGKIFRTIPLALDQWLWILVLTATILPVSWLARQIAYWVGVEGVVVHERKVDAQQSSLA